MKKLILVLTLFLAFGAVQNVSAQSEKRIRFAKGRTSATVSGVTGANGTYYILGARAGQKVTVTLTPRTGVGIKIEKNGPNGYEVLLDETRGGSYTIYLDAGGDFSIFLGSTDGRSKAFTMTVSITRMRDI